MRLSRIINFKGISKPFLPPLIAITLLSCSGGGGQSSDKPDPNKKVWISAPQWEGGKIDFSGAETIIQSNSSQNLSYEVQSATNGEAQNVLLLDGENLVGHGILIGDKNAAIFSGFSSSLNHNEMIYGGMTPEVAPSIQYEFFGDYYMLNAQNDAVSKLPISVQLDFDDLSSSVGKDLIDGNHVTIQFTSYTESNTSFDLRITDQNVTNEAGEAFLLGPDADKLIGGYSNSDFSGVLYLDAKWSD